MYCYVFNVWSLLYTQSASSGLRNTICTFPGLLWVYFNIRKGGILHDILVMLCIL